MVSHNPVISLFKSLWTFSKGKRHLLFIFIFLSIIAQSIMLLEPLIIGKILNIVQEEGITQGSLSSITWLLFSIIGLYIGFWAFHGPSRLIEFKNSFFARAQYKMYLMDGILHLSPKWHSQTHSGDTIDKIEKATTALFEFGIHVFEVVEVSVRFFGSLFVLAYFDMFSIIPVLIMTVISITVTLVLDKKLHYKYKQLNQKENDISAQIYDTISNITTVIIIRIEKLLSKEIFQKIMAPFHIFTRKNIIAETKWALVSLSTAIMLVWVLLSYIIVRFNANEVILVGTLYILYGYVQAISSQFFHFTYRYGDMVKWHSNIESINPITTHFRKKKKVKSHVLDTWKKVDIQNLTFSYEEDNTLLHLDGINISIEKGKQIAFIGESGSGKTTMLKLLRGLYHPKKGEVFIDGIKLTSGFSSIADHVTLIPQEPEIFSTTIKRNITMGVSYPKIIIQKFVRMARFTTVVRRLPKGLNTNVMEKGVSLSGGEKQRLALARGLLAVGNSEFILLDEPTSSVDAANELEIYKNIYRNFKGRTIISTVHNLSLLPLFDTIYMFRSGKIIAKGNFWDLMSNSKSFKRLWDKHKHETKENNKKI